MKFLVGLIAIFSLNAFAVCDGTSETTTVSDPVSSGNFNIEARSYRPLVTGDQKFPVVFILPPVEGETPLDGALAIAMCSQGIGAYIMNVRNEPNDDVQVTDLNVHEDTFIRAEFAINQYLNKLSNDSNVSGKFGIVGASLGAILSSYLAGIEPRLSASVIIAGGGNVAEMLATSEQEGFKSLREKRMANYQLGTVQEYEQFMSSWITREPLLFASSASAGSSYHFIMTRDTEMPTKNQRLLANAFITPKIKTISQTHIPGIVTATTVHADEIINFFKEKLK